MTMRGAEVILKFNVALTFHNVQNQTRVLKGVEVDHVAQRTVCQSRAEHRNVILKKFNTTFTD